MTGNSLAVQLVSKQADDLWRWERVPSSADDQWPGRAVDP